jgi:hypothetical protein
MELVDDILRYFLQHPQAADSAEGIVRWRLLDATVRRQHEQARLALAFLVDRGFLRARPSDQTAPLYELITERRSDALIYLAGRPSLTQPDER